MNIETKGVNQLTNRPTQSVVRWLEQDKSSAEFWRGEAFSLCAELGMLDCGDSDSRDKAGQQLAERLKEETQEASPLRGVDPYAEFVNAAIEDVDWYGVAQSLIGYVCEEIGAAYRADEAKAEGSES